jgi:hypothetical protein
VDADFAGKWDPEETEDRDTARSRHGYLIYMTLDVISVEVPNTIGMCFIEHCLGDNRLVFSKGHKSNYESVG